MTELALDPAARLKLALAGFALAEQRHDPVKLITSIEAILESAAHVPHVKDDGTN